MTWRDGARCRDMPPAEAMRLFFPREWDALTIAEARNFCFGCGVREECLTDARMTDERHGIRGGIFLESSPTRRRKRCSRCGSTDLMLWNRKVECVSCGNTWG